jgi:cytosine/adenosine deaminase-related metal-dependent hydrolase
MVALMARVDLLIQSARVLTLDQAGHEYARADIVIDGGIITALGPRAGEGVTAGRVISADGMLAMPGLVNCHYHSPGNLLKGAIPNLPLDLFMLYEVPPFLLDPASRELAYLRTSLGAVEMLRQGVTAVHDDAFFLPVASEDEITGVMEAYRDSGIRATVALDQPNRVEYEKHTLLRDLLPARIIGQMDSARRQSEEELVDTYRAFIGKWNGAEGGRLRAAVSCSAPQRVTASYLCALSDLSREHAIPYNMHVLETRAQRVFGAAVLGKSLLKYVDSLQALHDHVQVIHAIWVDESDIELLASAGCSVAHNPVSNLKVGSGIMPLRRLLDAGINLGLGTDEATVDDGVNYWTAMKLAGLIHNVADPDFHRWPAPGEILKMATSGGFNAMNSGHEGGGTLAPGSPADVILIDLDTWPFTPLNNLERQLVYCEPSGCVRDVIVAGEHVMADGALTTIDERSLREEIRSLGGYVDKFLQDCAAGARDIGALYEAAYWRQLQQPVPMARWAGPMVP